MPDSVTTWKGLLCRLLDHTEETLGERRYEAPRPEEPKGAPEPMPGHVLVETFGILYQIDAILVRALHCTRCWRERTEQVSVRDRDPIRISRWLAIPAEGRVVLPK